MVRSYACGLACGMKIRVDDPQLLDDLVHHLRRSGCVATPSGVEANGGAVTVEVELPAALDEEQARLELELYLKVFAVTHGPASLLT